MSDINPKNYPGSSVVIVGNAGGPFEVKTFDKGTSQAQLSIAVGKGYKKGDEWIDNGTDWYTLTATADYAQQNWPDVQRGDIVRVDDARLEFKSFAKKNGDPGVEATLRYGTLVIVKSKAGSSDAPPTDVTPF